MTETLANGYSSDSAQQELSNEYQHDRIKMIFIIFCFFVDWLKVTSASEGLQGITTFRQPWIGLTHSRFEFSLKKILSGFMILISQNNQSRVVG